MTAPSEEPAPDVIRRHSVPDDSERISDPQARAKREAENGFRQFDLGLQIVEDALSKGRAFRLRPSAILALHRAALQGLDSYAGNWRAAGVGIQGSKHEPM